MNGIQPFSASKGRIASLRVGSRTHPRLFKTGSGKNPWERLESEDNKHKGHLKLYILAIRWQEGCLEHLARKHLLEMPPDELGIQGIEYRMTNPKDILDAINSARRQYRALSHDTIPYIPPANAQSSYADV